MSFLPAPPHPLRQPTGDGREISESLKGVRRLLDRAGGPRRAPLIGQEAAFTPLWPSQGPGQAADKLNLHHPRIIANGVKIRQIFTFPVLGIVESGEQLRAFPALSSPPTCHI
jgi:hypothetical protein